jgi:hypothetical protein
VIQAAILCGAVGAAVYIAIILVSGWRAALAIGVVMLVAFTLIVMFDG